VAEMMTSAEQDELSCLLTFGISHNPSALNLGFLGLTNQTFLAHWLIFG
jgi:hypothetical protein